MRYYIAAKLNSKIEDIDLNLQDFISRVNSDLVGKYVNIAARASGFIAKRFEGRLKDISGSALLAKLAAESDTIAEQYENREYARALRDIMALADAVNEYVDANNRGNSPNKKVKTNACTKYAANSSTPSLC